MECRDTPGFNLRRLGKNQKLGDEGKILTTLENHVALPN